MAQQNLNLLSSTSHIETPFIKVKIGDYVFGVYDKVRQSNEYDEFGSYTTNKLKFLNYVKSLDITKINGQVNKYTLTLEYTITEVDDPNFFEKVFSSVNKSREITFSYGDLSMPTYCYRDEKALITDIKSDFTIGSSKITYKVSAVSCGQLLTVVTKSFRKQFDKPSNVIKSMLKDESLGLLEVFYGMRNGLSLSTGDLIPGNDVAKEILAKENISVLDYLRYLVDLMEPCDGSGLLKGSLYILSVYDDVSGELGGPYFKITQTTRNLEKTDAYEINIGDISSRDVVIDFHIDNDESYSIYYDFCEKLEDTSYVQRVNNRGELEEVYAPLLSSGDATHSTSDQKRAWWTKVTAYPIKTSITLKGLLRPAVLVSYVRLNVIFYGRKHISSGLYIVTKEQDTVNEQGFRTTLNLVRVSGDNDYVY